MDTVCEKIIVTVNNFYKYRRFNILERNQCFRRFLLKNNEF